MWQALDGIFHSWHKKYSEELHAWKRDNPGKAAGRSTFVQIFEKAWGHWVKPEDIEGAFRKVGWKEDTPGVDATLFPDDHPTFVVAAKMKAS